MGLVAVFAMHTHAEALDALIAVAAASGAETLWSLGDMVGARPDPDYVVARGRASLARSPAQPVHEYVGPSNAAACLATQRASLGLVGHSHAAAAWTQTPPGAKAARIRVGGPLDLSAGKWLLNPGAVGAPVPPRRA